MLLPEPSIVFRTRAGSKGIRDSPEGYWNLAAIREMQENLQDAIRLYREGMKYAPGDPRPLGQLAVWLENGHRSR